MIQPITIKNNHSIAIQHKKPTETDFVYHWLKEQQELIEHIEYYLHETKQSKGLADFIKSSVLQEIKLYQAYDGLSDGLIKFAVNRVNWDRVATEYLKTK